MTFESDFCLEEADTPRRNASSLVRSSKGRYWERRAAQDGRGLGGKGGQGPEELVGRLGHEATATQCAACAGRRGFRNRVPVFPRHRPSTRRWGQAEPPARGPGGSPRPARRWPAPIDVCSVSCTRGVGARRTGSLRYAVGAGDGLRKSGSGSLCAEARPRKSAPGSPRPEVGRP